MATSDWTHTMYVNTDALFRTWIDDFRAQLVALGLVRVTGVGEVNTSTALKPTVNNSRLGATTGYDIFRFNDSLQSTCPVFIRCDYYTNGGFPVTSQTDSNRMMVKFTVGFSQTAGVLNSYNISIPRTMEFCPKAAVDTTPWQGMSDTTFQAVNLHLFSGTSSRFTFFWGANAPIMSASAPDTGLENGVSFFCDLKPLGSTGEAYKHLSGAMTIERTLNADGSDNANGVNIVHVGIGPCGFSSAANYNGWNGINSYHSQSMPLVGSARYWTSWNCNYGGDRTSTMNGNAKAALPIYPTNGGQQSNPVKGLAGSMDFDFEIGVNPPTLNVYGSLKAYRKTSQFIRACWGPQWSSSRLLMLWE